MLYPYSIFRLSSLCHSNVIACHVNKPKHPFQRATQQFLLVNVYNYRLPWAIQFACNCVAWSYTQVAEFLSIPSLSAVFTLTKAGRCNTHDANEAREKIYNHASLEPRPISPL